MNKQRDTISSYVATPGCAIALFLLALLCAYTGFAQAFGYLLFLSLLALAAHLWGRFSAQNIQVEVHAQSHRVYPGQDLEMAFTLKNNKALPLMWLQWIQPSPPNQCLAYPSDFQLEPVNHPETGKPLPPVLCKRFSFVGWYATLTWKATFHAQRRGVYVPDPIEIYTGDGFGLSSRRKTYPLATPPVFVVYPRRVPVRTQAFFRQTWSASTGPHGVIEDVTLLRGTRPYQQSDSFKRINWRMAARGGDLSVNLYEHISPRSVYFFLDTATFHGESPHQDAFEETLSVIGSLTSQLFELGMAVGLYLPTQKASAHSPWDLEQTTQEDCLLALALAHCDNPDAQFDRQSMAQLLSTQSGNIYYVCHNVAQARCQALFEEVGIANYAIISHQEPTPEDLSTGPSTHSRIYRLADFKGG